MVMLEGRYLSMFGVVESKWYNMMEGVVIMKQIARDIERRWDQEEA